MAKDPAVTFYTTNFLSGTMLMQNEEVGAYIRLLCLQRENGHLTLDDINSVCGKEMPRVKAKFVQDENGLYFNERMDLEIAKRQRYLNAQQTNGSKGGRPPKDKEKTRGFQLGLAKQNPISISNINTKDIIKDNRGMGEEEKEEGRKKSPNKGISKAFIPPTLEEVREYARSKDCEDIADRFYEYFTDGEWKDSAGKPVRSWKQKLLTWRNKEPAKNKPPDNKPMKYGTFDPTEALNNAIRRTFEYPKRGADNGS